LNVGLHGGVISAEHQKAMGKSIWLYLWLVKRQTKANGLVLGGAPITYQRIFSEIKVPLRTAQRWLRLLREKGYVEISYLNYHQIRIRILKAKKFAFKQIPLPLDDPAKSGGTTPPKVADSAAKSGGVKQSGIRRSIKAKPNTHTQPACELVGFELFWQAYPNQVGKPAAFDMWLRVVRADDRWPEILAGIDRWKASGCWDEARYVPNPAKFLKEKRWVDIPPERGSSHARGPLSAEEAIRRTLSNLGVVN